MKFGAHYLPTYLSHLDGSVAEFYRRMFEQMEEIERLGFDSAWVTEHHFSDYGGTVPHPATFLSAIARTTRRIRLGVAISVLPLHNPLEIAESYAMVDVISNGRLEFGVGKGSEAIEYKRAGASQEEASGRMKEGMEIIRQAWSDEPVNFRGEVFEYRNVRVLPKPVQRPHPPVLMGGENAYALRRVVDYCEGWFPRGRAGEDTILTALADLKARAARAGRDMRTISTSVFGAKPDPAVIARFAEAGFTRVIFGLPSAERDTVLPLLDKHAKLIGSAR